MHPLVRLDAHESKLNGLLAHIQALGTSFVEFRSDASAAIEDLQNRIELLQYNEADPVGLQSIPEEPDNAERPAEQEMVVMAKELSARLAMESAAKDRIESKLEQVVRDSVATQERLVGMEALMLRLERELAGSRSPTRCASTGTDAEAATSSPAVAEVEAVAEAEAVAEEVEAVAEEVEAAAEEAEAVAEADAAAEEVEAVAEEVEAVAEEVEAVAEAEAGARARVKGASRRKGRRSVVLETSELGDV
jgi:hypothetical protein